MTINISLWVKKVDYRISAFVLLFAFFFLYLVGIQGFGKSSPFGDDFSVLYRAGTLFLQGVDPWLALMNSNQPFSYPPHSISLIAFYNFLPFSIAVKLHALLNLVSIYAICFCANKWFLKIGSFKSMTISQVFSLALLFGNPYVATSVYQGQLALPAAAAVFLSWYFLRSGRWILAGVLLAFATIKPQLSVLYVVWLLLSLNMRVLLVGGVSTFIFIIPGSIVFGALTPFESWITSISGYSGVSINAPGSPFVVGFESLLIAYGIAKSSYFLYPLSLLALLFLYIKRINFNDALIANMFFVLAFTFLFAHDYDYAAIIMIWSYAFLLLLDEWTIKKAVLFTFLVFFFFLPQRLIRGIDIPLVVHARTLILPLCCYLVFVWSKERKPVGEVRNLHSETKKKDTLK
jgi:Glycosyltransferase family 87